MLRFLPGVILLQLASVALVLYYPKTVTGMVWLEIIALLLIFSVLASLWFSSVNAHSNKDAVAEAKEKFAREREALRVHTEREKARITAKSHQQIQKETRRAHTQANIKVTSAIAGLAGLGTLMLFTQFLSIGMIALSLAGGGMVGYIARFKQERGGKQLKVIEPEKPRKSLLHKAQKVISPSNRSV
ncbi:MAG TPA: hypothetical protein ENJ84_13530 [Gammaproteobacteria bacterium]|nr:hypothetical protein [Gammaproteobacteria bacterium]